ncbi:delta-like protein C isoform X2 [Gigantopelta aegis]|uniref:delta-like protein C isoform X2 n=1 Tax=Gigantopelta aegis TaxID=1735272 RepID=UPI001B88DDAB|nr:delta-like protein C isoform X2 [Gigantopelta aegis]
MMKPESLCFLLLILMNSWETALSGAQMLVKFKRYDNPDGKGSNGHCCDGRWVFCFSECDHRFIVCLDRTTGPQDMNSCPYGKVSTSGITDRNTINFGRTIGGTRNPIRFRFDTWPVLLKIKVKVWDVDDNSAHEDVDFLWQNILQRSPGRGEATAVPRQYYLKHRTSLSIEVKVFCNPYYYGDSCTVYCKPRDDNRGHYVCKQRTGQKMCLPGWEGARCNINIDDCAQRPCLNGGTCTDHLRSYTCECQVGFLGVKCELNIDECASNPCHSGGSCVDGVAGFQCRCSHGRTGATCEHDINECASSPCVNGGSCYDLVANYTCLCPRGFSGDLCQLDTDECLEDDPCLNNGTCVNTVGSYSCLCPEQFDGKHCEKQNPCFLQPCQNGGQCSHIVGESDFLCNCTERFYGRLCNLDVDECELSPCSNNGTCVNDFGGYQCICPGAFQGETCEEDRNECETDPCLNNKTCINWYGGYHCNCGPYLQGERCETDVDECLETPCVNNGTCENTFGSYYCSCPDSFQGRHCDLDCREKCLNNNTSTNTTGVSCNETTPLANQESSTLQIEDSSIQSTSPIMSTSGMETTSSSSTESHNISTASTYNTSISSTMPNQSTSDTQNTPEPEYTVSTVVYTEIKIPTKEAPVISVPFFLYGSINDINETVLKTGIIQILDDYGGLSVSSMKMVIRREVYDGENGVTVTEIQFRVVVGKKRVQKSEIKAIFAKVPYHKLKSYLPYRFYVGQTFPKALMSMSSGGEAGVGIHVYLIVASVGILMIIAVVSFFVVRRWKRKNAQPKPPDMKTIYNCQTPETNHQVASFENILYQEYQPPEREPVDKWAEC